MVGVTKFQSVRHKGLRRFIERGDPSGLLSAYAPKLAGMITLLAAINRIDELSSVDKWNIHRLSGDRKGRWSFSVSRNWRLTFDIDEMNGLIVDLDLEDYH
ncbi:MAG: hypothetical protein RLZZ496_1115 [Pseudomonadota bacterium]